MKEELESIEYKSNGITVLIRPTTKGDAEYFVVDYRLKGERKLIWRSTIAKAKAAADQATKDILNGTADLQDFTFAERNMLLRARASLEGTGKEVDFVCHDYAELLKILDGRITPAEVGRDWIARNAVTLAKISIADAVAKVQSQAVADGKSLARQHELTVLLDKFAAAFNCEAHTITPSMVASYLTNLMRVDKSGPLSTRSKRNHKDVIKHLNTWLVLHGYLTKGTNWMEGVQKYSKRKQGDVTIYTPAEMRLIMAEAQNTPKRARWMVAFCAISGFCTIRHSELKRLDWAQIDFDEELIEILPVKNTKSEGRRRFIPMPKNLCEWLKTCRKDKGPVVPVGDSYTLLSRLIARAGVTVKQNALRHSSISYTLALTGEKERIADNSGNSVAMIESNYLRRVKPSQAKEWFDIRPDRASKECH